MIGMIRYDFKYKNPSSSTNNEIRIENIITTMKGTIYDKKTGKTEYIDIIEKPSLKENTKGYKYIWVEFNKDNVLMKNALDKKYFNIGEENIITKNNEEKFLDNFKKEYGKDLNLNQMIYKNSSRLMNEFYNNRINPNYKFTDEYIENLLIHYLNLLENKEINQKDYDKIEKILEDDNIKKINKNIKNEINGLFKDTIGNDKFFLPNELSKINKLIDIRNKIINKNPDLKDKYKEDKSIKAYAGDASFYPNIQINNMVDKVINKNEKYENINHLKRKY
jgi:hypothetical protein